MNNNIVDSLHEATHRVPGVPAHDDAAVANAPHSFGHHSRTQNPTPQHQPHVEHHDSPPRIFVAWQNWIAARVRKGR